MVYSQHVEQANSKHMKIQSTVTEHVNRGKTTFRFRFFDTDNVIEKTEDGKKIKTPITVAMSARSYSDIGQARAAMNDFENALGKPDKQIELGHIEQNAFKSGYGEARNTYLPIVVLSGFIAVAMTIGACSILLGWI